MTARCSCGTGGLTLKAKVLAVMEEQDRVWNADQMLDVLIEDRFPGLNANDPKSGIRTVFRRLVDKGLAVKEDYGRYRAAKWPAITFGATTATQNELKSILMDQIYDADPEPSVREGGYDPAEEPF